MKPKEIDKAINKLVMEKRLLNASATRTVSDEEKLEIKRRIIKINAEIRDLKALYDKALVEE